MSTSIQRVIHIFVFACYQEKENVEAADSDGDDFGGAAPPKAKKSAGKTVTFETDHVDGADEDDGTEFVEGDGAVSTTRKFLWSFFSQNWIFFYSCSNWSIDCLID